MRASYNATGMGVESRDLDRVGDLWGRVAEARADAPVKGWADPPIVIENILEPRLTPGRRGHWLLGVADEVPIPRGGRWASLGCGSAGTEVFAAGQGLFQSLLALDASPKALAEARKAAVAARVDNLEFGEANLNDLDLPREAFDVVLMNMSLHHVKNLEGTLDVVRDALRPAGFVVVNEFVGPAQFQFTDVQVAIANEILGVLPDRWRMDSTTGRAKTEYVRQPRDYWNLTDPSEAVRSDEIVPQLERRFEVVLSRDYGGTILHLVLEHIVHNFDRGEEKDVAAIRLLGLLEDLLIRHGVLESDFTLRVLRKGPRTGPSATRRDLMPGVEIEALRSKAAVLQADDARLRGRIQRLEASKVWRLAQALRGLVGRRW